MGIFKIEGASVKGEITPQGAKNEAYRFYVLLLTPEKL
jgi:hypothetical protein